jgi:hypothetical protein
MYHPPMPNMVSADKLPITYLENRPVAEWFEEMAEVDCHER